MCNTTEDGGNRKHQLLIEGRVKALPFQTGFTGIHGPLPTGRQARILETFLDFLGDEAGDSLSLPPFLENSFTIEKDPEVFKEPEKFIGF
jgi:hypothetical protein